MNDDPYLASVEKAARNGRANKPEIIFNRSSKHATTLVSCLLSEAENSVQIWSGNLNSDVYDAPIVIEALLTALSNGVTVDVLLDGRASILSKKSVVFLEILSLTNMSVKDMSPYKGNHQSHFIVVDKAKYRFEPDWREYEAFANFYDPTIGALLESRFAQAFAASSV
jgi:hypothetical protein